jgi:DNA-binding transcriptional ArsR family regulator
MPKANQNNGHDPNSDLVDRLMHALATPLRRRIVTSLMSGPASAKTLSAAYDRPLVTVSYHLSKVLFERCGVVKIVEINQRRGAEEKVYGLEPDAHIGIIKWPAIPASMRSGIHGVAMSSFLTAAIASMEAEPDNPKVPNTYSMEPVAVDIDGQRDIVSAVEDLRATVKSVAARCSALNPADLIQMIVGSAAFEVARGSAEENA